MRDHVIAEARQWLGTPYRHHARVMGVGVDCVQILCGVYGALGLIPWDDPGDYAHDWHLHRSVELYLEGLARMGALPTDAPTVGDVAVFRIGRTWSHGGILVAPDLVLHAHIDLGVIETRLGHMPLVDRKTGAPLPVRYFTLQGLT